MALATGRTRFSTPKFQGSNPWGATKILDEIIPSPTGRYQSYEVWNAGSNPAEGAKYAV